MQSWPRKGRLIIQTMMIMKNVDVKQVYQMRVRKLSSGISTSISKNSLILNSFTAVSVSIMGWILSKL